MSVMSDSDWSRVAVDNISSAVRNLGTTGPVAIPGRNLGLRPWNLAPMGLMSMSIQKDR